MKAANITAPESHDMDNVDGDKVTEYMVCKDVDVKRNSNVPQNPHARGG